MAIEFEVVHPDADKETYVSYSSFTSWLRCGKAFQLERILGVKAKPAWYFVGGSVVHTVTEQYDLALFRAEGR